MDIAVIIPDKIYDKNLYTELRKSLPGDIAIDLILMPKSYYEQKKEIGGVCFEINHFGAELYPNWKWL